MHNILLLTILLCFILYSSADFKINMVPSSFSSSLSSSTISPQLEQFKLVSRYFDHTVKKIVLDDGRVVKCKIPLLNTEGPSIPQVEEARNLTAEEAEGFLVHLKDYCTYHKTNDFLWQFCHDKYFRQYDDETTMRNAAKPKEELFFLGFHPTADAKKFESIITEGMRDVRPQRENHNLPIRLEIPSYKYIHTFGRAARVMNVKSMVNYQPDTLYYARVYVSSDVVKENDVVDLAGNTLGYYRRKNITKQVTKTFGGKEYIELNRFIIKVVSSYIVLLKDEFPMDIATSRVEVYSYKYKEGDKVRYTETTQVVTPSTRRLYLYGDIIYGHNAFLSDGQPYTSVLLSFDNENFFTRIIVEVIDDYAIRLDHGVGAGVHKALAKMILLGTSNKPETRNISWSLGTGKIFNMDQFILGKNTSFTKDFIRGDVLMIMEKNFDESWTAHPIEILEVKNDYLMQVRYEYRHFFETILSTSKYLVGKYADLEEEATSKITHKMLYRDPGIGYLNTKSPNSLLLVQYEEELSENEQLCNPSFAFPDPKSWLMTFQPWLMEEKANLMLHLSNSPCSTEGIEINFSEMKQVIIVNSKNKANFLRSEVKDYGPENYHKETIWILFEKGTLRVGKGHEISFKNQLISLKISDNAGLAYYTVNRQFSYNVKLNDIQVVSFPDIARESFALMSNLPERHGNITYFEHFVDGTFCPPINGKRRTDIEYKCSKTGKFFEIEDIKEPSTCHYHLIIGTRLLCPEEYPKDQDQGDLGQNINCFVQELY